MENRLTKKEELAIEYHMQGDSMTEAVDKAYTCKNRQVASAMATKLFRKEAVKERLSSKQEKQDEKTLEKRTSFFDQIDVYVSKKEVLEALAAGIKSNDRRVQDSMLDKYFKLKGLYSPNRNINMTLLDQNLGELRD